MDKVAEHEFREYVAARQQSLYRTAVLLTGNRTDAEDLVQTALTKLAVRWPGLHRSSSPDAYVRRILYTQQINVWRRGLRRRESPNAAPPETAHPGGDPATGVALRVTLAQALRRLTPKQRAVVVLRYYEDLPEAEVARILNCSVGTVRSQTHRTLARLRVLCPELSSILEPS